MILAIDIGNTRVKCAVFENTTLVENWVFDHENLEKGLEKKIKKKSKIFKIVVSNVGKPVELGFLKENYGVDITYVDTNFKFPFENNYKTPHTLGIDRMVLASGATILYPRMNRLIIDVGTCITYDFVNDKDEYLGGAISPGFALRYHSMNTYTSKLPLLRLEYPESCIGDSTENAMHAGVVCGIIHEIEGFISYYKTRNQNFIIILTGGDTVFLAKRLKNTIFANPNFLLESLIHTYQYKIEND